MTKMDMLAEMWRRNKPRSPEFSNVRDWLRFCMEVCQAKGATLSLKDKGGGLTTGNLRLNHPKYKGENAESLLAYDLARHKLQYWARHCTRKAEERTLRIMRGDGG